MKTIRQTYHIHTPIEKVWQAFIDPQIIARWGAGPARMDDQVGTKFQLWGGDIHGVNTEVITEKKLVQDWYGGTWSTASQTTFTFSEENGTTIVSLLHKDVPDTAYEEIEKGWEKYYLGPLKKLVESTK